MHDQSSRFLDRVQEDAGIPERGRALSGVRAVFYALFRPLGAREAGELAEALPRELESLWKPAYFQCLRDGRNGSPREGVQEALRRVQRLTPTVNGTEAGQLIRSVVGALEEELEDGRWQQLRARLPRDVGGSAGPAAPGGSSG